MATIDRVANALDVEAVFFVEKALDPMSIAPDAAEGEDGLPVASEMYLEAAA